MKRIFLLGLAVLGLGLSASAIRADDVVSVDLGTGLPVGPNFEGLVATFEWDTTTATLVPGSVDIVDNSGPLAPFSFVGEQNSPSYDGPGYVFEFENGDGDQWYVNTLLYEYVPGPGPIYYIPYTFALGTTDGAQDDVTCGSPIDLCSTDGFFGTYALEGEFTPEDQVPEPSSLALALVGIAALIFFRLRASKQPGVLAIAQQARSAAPAASPSCCPPPF